MCHPAFLAIGMAGVGILGKQMAAAKTNAAAEENAEALIAQANSAYSSQLIESSIAGGTARRKQFARSVVQQQAMSSVYASFNIHGTPKSDALRKLNNSAEDARYAYRLSADVRELRGKENMSNIFNRTSTSIRGLDVVSPLEQAVGIAGSVIGAAAWYEGTKGLEAPPNKTVASGDSGGVQDVHTSGDGGGGDASANQPASI